MNNSSILQKALPHIVAVVTFLVICCAYFSPQLNGKIVQAGDTISHKGMSREMVEYYNETGERTLWTNSMFGGMPTYQIGAVQPTNTLKYVEKTLRLNIPRPIGYFFAMMLGFYIAMILFGVNPWVSLIGAIAFSISTNNLVLFGAGHMTKLRTFAFFGFMFTGIVMAFRKKYLLGSILFALGFGVNLYANHIQMTYYLFMVFGIYGLIELVRHIQAGEMQSFGKAVLYLGIGGILAVGSSATSLWTTYEYQKDTMRGNPILVKEANSKETSSNTKGLDWTYAMQYSNGWIDLFSSFIPGVAGGGGAEPVSSNSAYAKQVKRSGGNPKNLKLPLYWGAVGKTVSTAGPVYFGAVMFFLFLLGMLIVKNPVKWGIGGGVILTMLLSLGDSLEFFNRIFFDYFPLYNKFRTPNSILAITAFLIPVLGTLAISEVISGKTKKEEIIKPLYITTGILGGICLFFAFMGGSFFDFTNPLRDANYVSNYNMNLDLLKADRAALMQSDALRSLGIILASAALIWAFLTNKIKENILLIGLAVITIGDLWTVGKRYLNEDNFSNKRQFESYKNPRPVDTQILKDKDLHYRVHDFTINAFNSSSTSYFHNTIGGYHPAKLQRIQDLIERNITPEDGGLRRGLSSGTTTNLFENTPAFNMLNTKYFIGNPEAGPIRNPNAMGNAWFVENFKMVDSPNAEIDGIKGLDVASTAIINNEFSSYVDGLNLSKNGSIKLTDYKPNHMTYQSNSTSEQLALFSEVWYGPNKGWQAYIDGNPVDHIRANYILRALKVPAGDHKIEFIFAPKSYSIGKIITLISSLIIVLAVLWLSYTTLMPLLNKQESQGESTLPKDKQLKKTTSKKKKK